MRPKLHFLSTQTDEALTARRRLEDRFGQSDIKDADILIPLGGDGFLLECLHQYHALKKPFYGLNYGTEGFLMNPAGTAEKLEDSLKQAQEQTLIPLRMLARSCNGADALEAVAFNEVSLFRQTRQTAKLKITIDGKERLNPLVGDGVLVSTPAGSTAYNLSAHGPVVPLGANLLALTPISPFRPRRWRGALIHQNSVVNIEILNPEKRPVSAVADSAEMRHVCHVSVILDESNSVTLLSDPDHHLSERVIQEQFTA